MHFFIFLRAILNFRKEYQMCSKWIFYLLVVIFNPLSTFYIVLMNMVLGDRFFYSPCIYLISDEKVSQSLVSLPSWEAKMSPNLPFV